MIAVRLCIVYDFAHCLVFVFAYTASRMCGNLVERNNTKQRHTIYTLHLRFTSRPYLSLHLENCVCADKDHDLNRAAMNILYNAPRGNGNYVKQINVSCGCWPIVIVQAADCRFRESLQQLVWCLWDWRLWWRIWSDDLVIIEFKWWWFYGNFVWWWFGSHAILMYIEIGVCSIGMVLPEDCLIISI